ncbi:propionyl-CoA synthetase [Entomortierella parvispora]|uniref:Propionyl-CoA synthetase n=1 Tax=Entomortierella parvispora TaxID=205924 RepID=A0A9P3H1K2_9FUNG|nr:propionyl-CoA synthetase [Entomortierella parvispora]
MEVHPQVHLQKESLQDPETYWGGYASQLHWHVPYSKVLHYPSPNSLPTQGDVGYTWFKDGELNTCYNAIDRHVLSGRGKQVAIFYDSPLNNEKRQLTYQQLLDEVQTCAGVLASHGAKKGDTILIYMPMVPEALVAMLACARLGVTHSVVFGGFAPLEIQKRINDCKPKLIIGGSCGIEVNKIVPYKEMLDKAIDMSDHKPAHRIIFQRDAGRAVLDPSRGDLDWNDEMQRIRLGGKQFKECVPVESQHPLYILYTSGTTGLPKGVVRDNGGHATQTLATMKTLFGAKPGDVVFCASDVGWVVGHSFICYGPLLLGCSTVLYEGKPVGTPDAGAFFRVLEEYKASIWYTAPTALRAIRRVDPEAQLSAQYDLHNLRGLYLAGERSDTGTIAHFRHVIGGKPVVDNYWSTESGSPITGACQGLYDAHGTHIDPIAIRQGAAGMAMPGYDIRVLSDPEETGGVAKELGPSTFGNIVVKLPLPPSALTTLWNNRSGFQKSYLSRFPGYYDTGDAGIVDDDGYVHVMSRTDDIMQVAGHRLSTGSVEQILAEHPAISECCVVPLSDKLKGQIPVGLVVLKFGVTQDEESIRKETAQMVRQNLGAIANYQHTYIIRRLPKTRSGKILRRTIRDIIAGKSLENQKLIVPATIEDFTVLNELEDSMTKLGLVGNDGEAGKVDDTVKEVKAKL